MSLPKPDIFGVYPSQRVALMSKPVNLKTGKDTNETALNWAVFSISIGRGNQTINNTPCCGAIGDSPHNAVCVESPHTEP